MVNSAQSPLSTSAPASFRPARWAVITMFVINGWCNANWVARIPDAKAKLGLSEGTLGIALFSAAAGALIAQVLSGWLISKYGSRRVTIGFAFFVCVAVALLGNSWSLATMMIGLALHGAGVGGMDVAMNVQATKVEQGYGRPIMTSFHGVWSVGSLVGAALGGFIAGIPLSINLHLVLVGLCAAVVIWIASRALINDDQTEHEKSGASFAIPKGALIGMGIMAFCVLCTEGAVSDWSTLYMRDTLGQAPQLATMAFSLFSGTMAIGRFIGDGLALRFGQLRTLIGSGVLVVVGIVLALVTSNAIATIVGFMLIGAGVACVFPLILSIASRVPGISPGLAISAMATSGYTGFLVGPPVIGLLADALTLRWALSVIALFGLLVIVISWRSAKSIPQANLAK